MARAVSMTRAAYDVSFAKLVSLVACRDSRRYENQRIIRYFFYWLARFVFVNSVLSLDYFLRSGTVSELPPPHNK